MKPHEQLATQQESFPIVELQHHEDFLVIQGSKKRGCIGRQRVVQLCGQRTVSISIQYPNPFP
jgi:hypothetical protein